jgi:hypothetical protein
MFIPTNEEIWDRIAADQVKKKVEEKEQETPWLANTPVEQRYEYLGVRFALKGYGHTQEFDFLAINGRLQSPWKTLPEMLKVFGENGWTLVTHTSVSDGASLNGNKLGGSATQHMTFSRPLQ